MFTKNLIEVRIKDRQIKISFEKKNFARAVKINYYSDRPNGNHINE